jgi:hypothetical protein
LALRVAHTPGGATKIAKRRVLAGEALRLEVHSAIGKQIVSERASAPDLSVLRVTVQLTPITRLLIPFLPRDLYPLGKGDDPLSGQGKVEAAQRGLNSGQIFFHLDEPAFGSVLYFQNHGMLAVAEQYLLGGQGRLDRPEADHRLIRYAGGTGLQQCAEVHGETKRVDWHAQHLIIVLRGVPQGACQSTQRPVVTGGPVPEGDKTREIASDHGNGVALRAKSLKSVLQQRASEKEGLRLIGSKAT